MSVQDMTVVTGHVLVSLIVAMVIFSVLMAAMNTDAVSLS